MNKKATKHAPKSDETSSAPTKGSLIAAYNALASMPDDFFAEGRVDTPPEPVPSWDHE
jgi:hypothetical protein